MSLFDNGYVVFVDIIEAKVMEEVHSFVTCEMNEETIRTKMSSKSKSPIYNFRGGPLVSKKKMEFVIYKVSRFGKKPTAIGGVEIKSSKLGVDIPIDEWHSIVSNKQIIGALHLRLTRSALTRPPRVKKVGELWVTMKTFDSFIEDSPKPTALRSHFLSKPKNRNKTLFLPNGLFLGIAKIGLADLVEDLKDYFAIVGQNETNPFLIPFSGEIKEIYPQNCEKIPQNIWLFCEPDGLRISRIQKPYQFRPFVMTDADGTARYVEFLITYEEMSSESQSELCKKLNFTDTCTMYEPVILAVFCETPIFSVMQQWLWGIHSSKFMNGYKKDYDSAFYAACDVITNRTEKVKNGEKNLFQIFDSTMVLQFPQHNDIPYSPFNLSELFNILTKSSIIQIFNYLLVGERLVFSSNDAALLVRTIENFKLLLYPLHWVYVCVPILPRILLEYITSPFPYILGLLASFRADAADILRDEELIFIDLDNGIISSSIKHHTPDLPNSVTERLIDDLMQITIIEFDDGVDDLWTPPSPSNIAIQLCFFKAIIQLVRGFEKYVGFTWISDQTITHFEGDAFVLSHTSDQEDFLKSFIDTYPFKCFIDFSITESHSAAREWIDKNVETVSIGTLTKLYNSNDNISFEKMPITSPFPLSKLHFDVTKLLKTIHRLPEPKTVCYKEWLTCTWSKDNSSDVVIDKKAKKISVISNEKFVDKLIRTNNENSAPPDCGTLFNDLSDARNRYRFLKYLHDNQHKFVIPEFGPESVINSVTVILVDIFKTISKFCNSQHDTLCATLILEITSRLCHIENIVQEPLCVLLKGMVIWDDMSVWMSLYHSQINKSKTVVLGVSQDVLFKTISEMDEKIKKTLSEKENAEAIGIIHSIAKTMKSMALSNDFIKSFVSRITTMLPLDESKKDDLECIINVITRITLVSDTFQSDDLYDSIYF
ncbi:hypothetical protein EIN_312910 [Entamoeba invadens IP1]|uniref:UDENN domain-containing protein n=1 Tax=Entamoeba invadens IP1 TaxID=370355 RepID=A0A0A1UCM3_ENTIV|nr:hypothetical protein EIN_312910 [Entamoeba invadens IP1]ELP92919.1 hypothetical protein EIN_312910 [Entamoeba invadens IP1]|eukprot:XP_004259690.1 hypothetical protein EIN_312910 [Entamoeba invadens IP1]